MGKRKWAGELMAEGDQPEFGGRERNEKGMGAKVRGERAKSKNLGETGQLCVHREGSPVGHLLLL